MCTSFAWVLIGLRALLGLPKDEVGQRREKQASRVFASVLLFFPFNGWTMWTSWDFVLHVFVFLITFYFQYYTMIYLNWKANSLLSSVWVLFVSKWFVPFIGITWMYLAYEISGKLSAKEESLEQVEPEPKQTKRLSANKAPASRSGSPGSSMTSSRTKFRRNYTSYRKQMIPNHGHGKENHTEMELLMKQAKNVDAV
jgi:hypothetical protein